MNFYYVGGVWDFVKSTVWFGNYCIYYLSVLAACKGGVSFKKVLTIIIIIRFGGSGKTEGPTALQARRKTDHWWDTGSCKF